MIDFNFIETGNTVFIYGLPKSQSSFNNQYGILKEIFINKNNNYVGEIEFLKSSTTQYINFDHIFNISADHFTSIDIKSIIWENNPYDHYVMKHTIVESIPFFDDKNQIYSIGIDDKDKKYMFLYSGLN